jgi:uncharacterized repeat protein (TIGR01451 family)
MFKNRSVCWLAGFLVLACAGQVMAATDITNTCTGQYEVGGRSVLYYSGLDTALGHRQGDPLLAIAKAITNLRTGVSDPDRVSILQGDTVEFTITWSNDGEATADTLAFNDYVPAGMTFLAGSETFTSTANCTGPAISESGGKITFTATAAAGTDPGAKAQGVFKFTAIVD